MINHNLNAGKTVVYNFISPHSPISLEDWNDLCEFLYFSFILIYLNAKIFAHLECECSIFVCLITEIETHCARLSLEIYNIFRMIRTRILLATVVNENKTATKILRNIDRCYRVETIKMHIKYKHSF